jgi:hypothetical protein
VAKQKTGKESVGRPARHSGERLSKNRTFRVRRQLDDLLTSAAERSERSVSEEIEFRLEQTFANEAALEMLYGVENAALLSVFGELFRSLDFWAPVLAMERSKNAQPGAKWLNDPFLFDQAIRAINVVLGHLKPAAVDPAAKPKGHEATLSNLGANSALAMMKLLAGAAEAHLPLQKSGWADNIRSKLAPSTLAKIDAANSRRGQETDG